MHLYIGFGSAFAAIPMREGYMHLGSLFGRNNRPCENGSGKATTFFLVSPHLGIHQKGASSKAI